MNNNNDTPSRERIAAYCRKNGYDTDILDILTEKEAKALRDEVAAVDKGMRVLDGFFSLSNITALTLRQMDSTDNNRRYRRIR